MRGAASWMGSVLSRKTPHRAPSPSCHAKIPQEDTRRNDPHSAMRAPRSDFLPPGLWAWRSALYQPPSPRCSVTAVHTDGDSPLSMPAKHTGHSTITSLSPQVQQTASLSPPHPAQCLQPSGGICVPRARHCARPTGTPTTWWRFARVLLRGSRSTWREFSLTAFRGLRHVYTFISDLEE